jgi:lysozyme
MKYDINEFIKMVAKHEGIVLEPYKDSLGISTIGIGRNLEDRGITDGELDYIGKTMEEVLEKGLTEEEAYYLCMNDIAIVEKELLDRKPIVNQLNDVRQMVLVDMAFNMGVPRLMKFKNMWMAIEKVNYPLACEEMIDSRWANQVGNRAMKLSLAMKNGEWI